MATSKFNSNSKEEKRMNTKELLFKLAGNNSVKQYRADLWPVLIPGPITEAQGKLLLSYDIPDHYADSGIKRILNMAVSLVEPVYLRTVLMDYAGEGDGNDYPNKCISNALDFLTTEGKRTILKSSENLHNLVSVVEEAMQIRNSFPHYALLHIEEITAMPYAVDNIYKAAWCILNAYELEDDARDRDYDGDAAYGYERMQQYSVKQLKATLKTPERIDRYAQIVHKEYDYSIGYLLEAKELIESLNISEFEPIWFRTSEDIADEGAIMNNCIAGYWHDHGISCCVFACIYKGHRLDIEIAKDKEFFSIKQCLEKDNKATELTDELGLLLLQAISEYYFTALMAQDTTIVLCESRHGDCFTSTETGEIIIDAVQQHSAATSYIKGAHPITGEPVVYKIIYSILVNGRYRYALKNITGTPEEYAVFHNLQKEFNYYTSATQKYGIILCDESNDYTEVCIRFSDYDGIENTKGSYLYSIDTGAIYKIVEIDETTITILNITNEDEGINALAQYNIAHGIEFDDDFDDYDDDFAPRFDGDYELFD